MAQCHPWGHLVPTLSPAILLLFLLPSVAAAVPPPVGMVVAEPEDDPPISKWHSGDSHSFPWQRGGEADDGVCQEVVFLGC